MMANPESESDFSSSDEDDDYVPSGEEESCDELEGVVDEENTEDSSSQKKKLKTKGKGAKNARRRKGWSALTEDTSNTAEDDKIQNDELEDRLKAEELEKKKEEKQKKKADDLWSSFLSDVGQKSKPKVTESRDGQCDKVPPNTAKSKAISDTAKISGDEQTSAQPNGKKASNTVTVTKVFDFAGEEIRVTKEVAASSREAKNFLKTESQEKDVNSTSGSSSGPSSIMAPKPAGLPGIKRPGAGLGSVLGQIGKKQKMSTLEKSRMDWVSFKKTEGIEEDLRIHNKGKDGYIEKQRFLERADHRQYEIEREIRMSQSKTTR